MSRKPIIPTMTTAQVLAQLGKPAPKRRNPYGDTTPVVSLGAKLDADTIGLLLDDAYQDALKQVHAWGYSTLDVAYSVVAILEEQGYLQPDGPMDWHCIRDIDGLEFTAAVNQALALVRPMLPRAGQAGPGEELVREIEQGQWGKPPAKAAKAANDPVIVKVGAELESYIMAETLHALFPEKRALLGGDFRNAGFNVILALVKVGATRLAPSGLFFASRDIRKSDLQAALNTLAAMPAPAPARPAKVAPAPAAAAVNMPHTMVGEDGLVTQAGMEALLDTYYPADVARMIARGADLSTFAAEVVHRLYRRAYLRSRGRGEYEPTTALRTRILTDVVADVVQQERDAVPARTATATASAVAPAIAKPSPDTSAYAFPKRCVGAAWSGGAVAYRFTMIAPACKMPLRFVRSTAKYETKYYGVSPDRQRIYVGGYQEAASTRDFNGHWYVRQHMLPGVIARADYGKGVGPAAYMAGPLMAAIDAPGSGGTWSYKGGRTNDATAAWENLVRHKTAVQELVNARTVHIKTSALVKALSGDKAIDYLQIIQGIEPDVEVTVRGAERAEERIERPHILGLGIVLHIDPQYEAQILGGLRITTPIVPPPGIWAELDLSATDTASLEEFLNYCSAHYAKHSSISALDYLRVALDALKQNPSTPLSAEELDAKLATIQPAKRKRARSTQALQQNPDGDVEADLSHDTRLLSDFLNDEDWSEGAGVQNPAPRTWIPPANVAAEARRGIELRASQPPSNRCCTHVGLRRAVQLANRQPVSEATLRRMRAYFDRHYGPDSRGKGWGTTSKGFQAHLCWGGDAGRKWVESILGERHG